MASLGRSLFEIGYELSPIILTNGVAQGFPGSMMPIILITQAAGFITSLLSGGDPFDTNGYLGHFRPVPGGTLVDNEIGDYPFANQAVAANAIIARPLRISMLMVSPVNQAGGYVSKLISFTSLKSTLDKHSNSGGTFTIATPSFIYTNCILTNMRDVSNPSSNQAQNQWQFDFVKPLLALDQAGQVLNSLMSKISGSLPIIGTPSWSGISSAIGSVTTGLGSLGSSLSGLGSLNLSSFSIPGLGSVSSLSSLAGGLTDNAIGTAVSGIQSTVSTGISGLTGGLSGAASGLVANLRLP